MRRPLRTAPCITPAHHRVHIRTEVLLRHTLEAPLHGRIGIDLHLGQKPKLGAEVYRHHTHLYIIFCRYSVYPCFVSFFLFVVSCFVLVSQNTKRPKIFLLFLFVRSEERRVGKEC